MVLICICTITLYISQPVSINLLQKEKLLFAGVIPFIFVFVSIIGTIFLKNDYFRYGLIIITVIIYIIWISHYLEYHIPDLKTYSW